MSLNIILANSETVGINDQKFVGQTVSRDQRISTAEVLSVQPFTFDMKPMSFMLYSKSRAMLSALRTADRLTEQYLNFGSTGWLNYIAYQGDMTGVQAAACQWQITSANKVLVLGSLPSITSTLYICKTGDFLQVGRYAYIATADVQRGAGSTVSIPVHRNLIAKLASPVNAVIGQYGTTVSMGGSAYTGVTFPVIVRNYPNYNLVPMTNDSYISFNGSFQAMESVV
jgi:hypothetical protein